MASKKPKPAKIMAPAHPFTASGAQTTTVWAKPTKKPKPATAGEKIARSIWLVEDEDLGD